MTAQASHAPSQPVLQGYAARAHILVSRFLTVGFLVVRIVRVVLVLWEYPIATYDALAAAFDAPAGVGSGE